MADPKRKPTKEEILDFLNWGITAMKSEDTRTQLKDKASIPAPGKWLVEMQRSGWDPLGIDKDVGCKALDDMHLICSGDTAALELRAIFVVTAQRTYLQAMIDRKPKALETKFPMTRAVIMDFFDMCDTAMDLPENQEKLHEHMRTTKQVPNQLIIDIQRDMLEVLGWQRDHGCAMLSRIVQDFPDDIPLFQRFEAWRVKAQTLCMLVVRTYQMNGGEMPDNPFTNNPEFVELEAEALEALEKMTAVEKDAMLAKMQKRIEIFVNLPPDGQVSYLKKLTRDEKLQIMKTQLFMLSVMKRTWQDQQSSPQMESMGPGVACGTPVAAPAQQQM